MARPKLSWLGPSLSWQWSCRRLAGSWCAERINHGNLVSSAVQFVILSTSVCKSIQCDESCGSPLLVVFIGGRKAFFFLFRVPSSFRSFSLPPQMTIFSPIPSNHRSTMTNLPLETPSPMTHCDRFLFSKMILRFFTTQHCHNHLSAQLSMPQTFAFT